MHEWDCSINKKNKKWKNYVLFCGVSMVWTNRIALFEKSQYSEFFWCVFPHSNWIQSQWGKYWPKKPQIRTHFTQCRCHWFLQWFLLDSLSQPRAPLRICESIAQSENVRKIRLATLRSACQIMVKSYGFTTGNNRIP